MASECQSAQCANVAFLRRTPQVVVWVSATLLALAIGVLAQDSHAQSADDQLSTATVPSVPQPSPNSTREKPPTSTATQTLGEIEVTATRRREPTQDVPLRVESVSTQDLLSSGAKTLADYVSYQPGAFFASSGGAGEGQIIIRGISTGDQTSPTVSVYVDDVPVGGSTVYAASSTFVFDMSLMDLDHLEFLYGPQGTLYGAGSMGGLLKYVTNMPDPTAFSGSAGVDLSSTDHGGFNHTEDAVVNVPLSTNVAFRAAVFDENATGVYDAIGAMPGRHIDSTTTQGGRLQLLFTPTDKLSIRVSAMGQRIDAGGLSMADYNLDGTPQNGPYDRSLNKREPFHQNLELFSLNAAYDFGWAQLDWINAYQNFVNDSDTDYPSAYLDLLQQVGVGDFSALYDTSYYHVHKYSEELRLTSPTGPKFDWLAGLWFTHENVWSLFNLLGDNQPPPGIAPLIYQFTTSSYKEYAGYGDVTYHLTPAIDITGGVRASGNSQTLVSDESGVFAGTPGVFNETSSGNDVTELLTARYKIADNNTVYFRAASGYRPGGLQAPVTDPLIQQTLSAKTTFGPDNLESYEVGYKSGDPNSPLRLDVDAYHVEWHHVQLYTYDMGYTVIENAGNARVDGLELSGSLKPQEHWLFTGSVALINARLTQDDPAIGVTAGSALPYTAKAAGSFSTTYEFQFEGHSAFVRAIERASRRRNSGFNGDVGDPNFVLPGYGLLDFSSGIELPGVNFGLYVRNALDHRVPMGALNVLAVNNMGGPILVSQSTPRTVGVTLNVPIP